MKLCCIKFVKSLSHPCPYYHTRNAEAYLQCRFSSTNTTVQPNRRLFLSTSCTKRVTVPLTLTDIHLRNEQLPFAYVFKETLDQHKLVSSLKEVLKRYPILGATPTFSPGNVPMLVCDINDNVPISFVESDSTIDQWLVDEKSWQMQHVWQSDGGAPTLSPLFDDLISAKWIAIPSEGNGDSSTSLCADKKEHMATVRVTYFKDSGTAIAINLNHMLGDANSCFLVCQVWGREMRGLQHPTGASNIRANATLTGMISHEMASVLNLNTNCTFKEPSEIFPFFTGISSYVNDFIRIKSCSSSAAKVRCTSHIDHEYVHIELSTELLHAMKSYGNLRSGSDPDHDSFVSTNDMITAISWLIKRRISNRHNWNLSMVVNLRNRGGIHAFSSFEYSSIGTGVFGNALTCVIAKLPNSSSTNLISVTDVYQAAVSIREALTKKMAVVEDLQMQSRNGIAAAPPNQDACFSSTSWMQFPLWDICFKDDVGRLGHLHDFYGRPSFPLPDGDTYSSINVPNRDNGCILQILAPTRQVQSILALSRGISAEFLNCV